MKDEAQGLLPFNGRPPFAGGSKTSEAAADSVVHSAGLMRAKVLRAIAASSNGATCDEIEVTLGMPHQTASARIRELAIAGQIADVGVVRLTRRKRRAVAWKVTEGGSR